MRLEVVRYLDFFGGRRSVQDREWQEGHVPVPMNSPSKPAAHKKIEVDLEQRILSLVSLGVEFEEVAQR